jgi:dihydroneopterin aldolase / 2-amino-4-hydroxy-6-hydroxymethyldihydropteridine diphosphokinase / dihydropteroate synthase
MRSATIPSVYTSLTFNSTHKSAVSDQDTIRVRDLLLLVSVADGAQWPSPTSAPVRQPLRVSVSIPYDLRPAAQGDDISKSINYGSLSKRILTSVDAPSSLPLQFDSLEHFSDHVFDTCFDAFAEIQRMTVDIVKPRALPYAEGIRILSSRARDGSHIIPDHFSIQRLSCNLVVGLNPCEREDKQLVYFDVDISMSQTRTAESRRFKVDFRQLGRDIRQVRRRRRFACKCKGVLSKEQSASRVFRVCIARIACVSGGADRSWPR